MNGLDAVSMKSTRALLIWVAVLAVIAVPVIAAAGSPLLVYRRAPYIAAGFAGMVALALLLVQPLLVGAVLPGFSPVRSRQIHRYAGAALVLAVVVHVAGLWLTSAPDVIDALTFTSPTPFSPWGVVAMWAIFASAALAALRRRLAFSPRLWRALHTLLAAVIVTGGVTHSLLIEGTMETWSKAALCAVVVAATATVIVRLWFPVASRGSRPQPR